MESVLVRAGELAVRNHARLTIYDVVPQASPRRRYVEYAGVTIDIEQSAIDARRRQLEDAASLVPQVDVVVEIGTGVRFVAVIKKVLAYGHDLVITPPDPNPKRRGFAGATDSLHLLRKCPCPIWIDDPESRDSRDVIVAVGPLVDDEPPELNRTLLQLGSSLARIQGGSLHTVHAWRLVGESQLRHGRMKLPPETVDKIVEEERLSVNAALTAFLEDFDLDGLDHRVHLRHGRASEVIAAVADEVGPAVVVMGTLARWGLPGLFIGTNAERVLGYLTGSVLAVKPPGFVSPVNPG